MGVPLAAHHPKLTFRLHGSTAKFDENAVK